MKLILNIVFLVALILINIEDGNSQCACSADLMRQIAVSLSSLEI